MGADLAIAVLVAAQASAPVVEPPAEIVVTGERLPRSLRDTPSSVAVFTNSSIEKLGGVERLDDLFDLIPNVQLGNGSEGPSIRAQDTTGVLYALPSFLGGARPRMTLQVDGRAVSYNEFIFGSAPLWDVRQVEVYRSAQTTTQGRNAIAGAIFVETRNPTNDWSASARMLGGNLHARQASAFVTGPLSGEQLSFRLSGDLRRGRPASKIGDNQRGADPNHDDYELLRFKLLLQPSELPGARILTTLTHTGSFAPQVVGAVAPFRDRRDPDAFYGIFRVRTNAATSLVELPVNEALNTTTTFSVGRSKARRFAPPGVGETSTTVRDYSLEPIVRWHPSSSFRITGGLNYLHTRLRQFIDLSAIVGPGQFRDQQHSFGLFGEAEFKPVPSLTLTAGARYQRDRQKRRGLLAGPLLSLPIDFDESFSAWLPKVSLSYAVTPDVTAGILIQRAYNPGGTFLNFDTATQETFGAEYLWSYEAFGRASLAGGALHLTSNLFFNRFRDGQRALPRTYRLPDGRGAGWAEIFNVPEARAYGLEAAAEWSATDRLRLSGGVGLLKTKIVDRGRFELPLGGKSFARAPAFTGSAALDWRPTQRLSISAVVKSNSAYFSDDTNEPDLRIAASARIDVRAAYDAGRFTVFGYARNLLDKLYLLELSSDTEGELGGPREVGVGLESRF